MNIDIQLTNTFFFYYSENKNHYEKYHLSAHVVYCEKTGSPFQKF